ncbi:hypothetical protein BO78DRAFT_419884 [Aspergillus sclerotiicarbonarius CBS 121057]|uniref:Uncharacterized protein n=1 Tax=Aspergillus sclerotiicarbonarius (strain CBS 121057 / IBT 28362) TaxID=1448318 RepID=A0A319E549_ASPSB|nr:hypothetical protein BO78DRAFT_419884 [Aspergillus sclerotiicarbonarius CBS 121057]
MCVLALLRASRGYGSGGAFRGRAPEGAGARLLKDDAFVPDKWDMSPETVPLGQAKQLKSLDPASTDTAKAPETTSEQQERFEKLRPKNRGREGLRRQYQYIGGNVGSGYTTPPANCWDGGISSDAMYGSSLPPYWIFQAKMAFDHGHDYDHDHSYDYNAEKTTVGITFRYSSSLYY